MLNKAIAFATASHIDQNRKNSGLPYITHPLEVMVLLIRQGVRDEETLAAAVLHDVVEDCEVSTATIVQEFGATVAGIVAALTKAPGLPDEERKRGALDQLRRGPKGAKSVKMADRLSNIIDLETINWSAEKKSAYLREADEIAEIGALELPSLGDELRRVSSMKRTMLSR